MAPGDGSPQTKNLRRMSGKVSVRWQLMAAVVDEIQGTDVRHFPELHKLAEEFYMIYPRARRSIPASAGDQLDAERRGDVYDPCRGCIHEAHELPCLAVIDAGRAQRCGCHTRKSESLKEI